jgi:hypothetical protein
MKGHYFIRNVNKATASAKLKITAPSADHLFVMEKPGSFLAFYIFNLTV